MGEKKDVIVFVMREYQDGPVSVAFGSPIGESMEICSSIAEQLGIGVKFVERDGEPVWTPFKVSLIKGVMETKITFPAPQSMVAANKKTPRKSRPSRPSRR